MQYYQLIRCYYDFCDIHKHTVGFFSDKDLAEYLRLEYDSLYGTSSFGTTTTWFEVNEIEIITNPLEDWAVVFEQLKKEAE